MALPETVKAIMLELSIAGQQVLYLMLSADGVIHRLGTGSEGCQERTLFIGQVPPDLFSALSARVDTGVMQWRGRYTAPSQQGKECVLTVALRFLDEEEHVSEWVYGSQSQGPPPPIAQFVLSAVEATHPWYVSQKRLAAQS